MQKRCQIDTLRAVQQFRRLASEQRLGQSPRCRRDGACQSESFDPRRGCPGCDQTGLGSTASTSASEMAFRTRVVIGNINATDR